MPISRSIIGAILITVILKIADIPLYLDGTFYYKNIVLALILILIWEAIYMVFNQDVE